MCNGSYFEWHSKTKQLEHSISDQIATILDSYVLVPFLKGRDNSNGLIILILAHLKSEHQNIQIFNGLQIQMSSIQTSFVYIKWSYNVNHILALYKLIHAQLFIILHIVCLWFTPIGWIMLFKNAPKF